MSINTPIFLAHSEVLELHTESLARYGGTEGLRDPGLLESAIYSAQNAFFYAGGDLFDVAAAYAFHIAQAQAFLDGNKRTAMTCALVFLRMNGVSCPVNTNDLYRAMIGFADKSVDKAGFAALLRKISV